MEKQLHPEWSYGAVLYEMNVRQYTPEGTFEAAARELPRLKELGVDAIWLSPFYPSQLADGGYENYLETTGRDR